jgi:hypothetical protein
MSNTETVMSFITALQSGDIELAANRMTSDFTMSGFFAKPLDESEFLVMQSKLLAAMPDFSYNTSELQEEEQGMVKALLQITGTQSNDLDLSLLGIRPIQATGLAVTLPQTPVTYQMKEGKIASMKWEQFAGGGMSGLLQQIGAELPLAPRGVTIAD